MLRHTFCTRMCESDVNIKILQDIMENRNISTTMEPYAKAM
ncbi:MAG: tyrosine-type recombinase/integrase [Oscillospiraceae bacterium]|nr:tyrosine-type recombinase/integrase [Oscillospiraceae bacterium]